MAKINLSLIKQALISSQANRRSAGAHTKTRGEVSGGGKKPWKQKGTGRARAGSSRSPLWKGGGITFGPRSDANPSKRLPKKMTIRAKEELLKLKKDQKLLVEVQSLHLKEPRTKLAVQLLTDLKLAKRKVILVTLKLEPELILAVANLPGIEVCQKQDLSIDKLIDNRVVALEVEASKTVAKSKEGSKPKATTRKRAAK